MELISKTENDEKTIKFTMEEYEDLLVILDQSQLPDHRKNLQKAQAKLWCDLYDLDLD
jgi:uncharacterized protein (DUF1778 family)